MGRIMGAGLGLLTILRLVLGCLLFGLFRVSRAGWEKEAEEDAADEGKI